VKVIDFRTKKNKQSGGFTLIELLLVVILTGIIAALAGPYFGRLIAQYNLKRYKSEVYQAISQAQAYSSQRRENWQFSLCSSNGILQYAVHLASQVPTTCGSSNISWTSLPSTIALDTTAVDSTAPAANITMSQPTAGIYQVCFNDQGLPSTPSGTPQVCPNPASFSSPQQLTFVVKPYPTVYRRCIIIKTLLGDLTDGKERGTNNSISSNCY